MERYGHVYERLSGVGLQHPELAEEQSLAGTEIKTITVVKPG